MEYTDYFDEFKRYRLNIFSTIQKKLGWDAKANEDPLIAMLRPMILSIVGKSGDQGVIDEAQKRFKKHIAGELIDPNIRGTVYVIVSRYGDEKTQEELRKVSERPFADEKRMFCLVIHGSGYDRRKSSITSRYGSIHQTGNYQRYIEIRLRRRKLRMWDDLGNDFLFDCSG